MSKADRLLLILNLIRARKNLTIKELSKECEVSERTIYRDINAISAANIPIYYNHGYKFLTDAFLPPLNLSTDEYLVICLGLNSQTINSTPILKTAIRRVMAKIECSLPDDTRNDCLKIKKTIVNLLKQKDHQSIKSFISKLLKQGMFKESRIT